MAEIPKRLKRLLREWAGTAHEEELRRALLPLAEEFDRWKRGDITSADLCELIHKFHQRPARDLFVKYNTKYLEASVAHAVVTGVLEKEKIPLELLEHLATWIRFYEADQPAEGAHEDDIAEDDEKSRDR